MSGRSGVPVVEAVEETLPSLEEADARLAAHRLRPLPPWLTPEGLSAMAEAVASGIPEMNGPMNPDDLPEYEV
jgi:hypothetical protein